MLMPKGDQSGIKHTRENDEGEVTGEQNFGIQATGKKPRGKS